MARTLQLVVVEGREHRLEPDGGPIKQTPDLPRVVMVTVGESVTLSEFPFAHLQRHVAGHLVLGKHLAHCRCSSSQGCYELRAVVLGVELCLGVPAATVFVQ